MDHTDFDPSTPDPNRGERLGVWRLQRPLCEVPSGQWWRAQHAMSQQPALVLVYARSADAGAVLLRVAQAEGQPWTHPDIAWPLDSGLTGDGRPYVVMPMLDGEPLLQAIANTSLRRRIDWVLQLCELLLLAQARGLALVELDPSLLWVGPQQQLRLHALALVRADAQALRLGSLQGQVSEAAQPFHCPVSLQGTPGGAQAQVYSVGMLMCLLVNGRLPNDALPAATTTVQALTQWVSLTPTARAALDGLLRDSVQADPALRPADLGELGNAIEAWLEQTGASAGTGAGVLAAAPVESEPEPESEAEPSPLTVPAAPPQAAASTPAARPTSQGWVIALLFVAALAAAA